MILSAITITWLVEIVIVLAAGAAPWSQFSIIGPIIVALLANDAERQGPKRTLLGVSLITLLIFSILVWFSAY
ncbi:MAG: hypothetical protein GY796_04980, partial [Chloroflexi bacterium]|nr:hypothetical protein [Chloroflexota bacterium]